MPVTFQFWGNQVGTLAGITDDGNGNSVIDVGGMPFLATDLIEITITDASFDGSGEFLGSGPIEYLSVKVTRDGTTYDLSTDPGDKIKESGGGTNEHQGDTFFHSNNNIGPAASGPFDSIPEDQYVFLSSGTLSVGNSNVISRVENGGNANFGRDEGDEPVAAVDDTATLTEDDGSTAFPSVVNNDDVPDGVDTVTLITGPAEGSLTLNADGTYSFDPLTDFDDLAVGESRDVTFDYEVTDLDGDSNQATVTITVTGTNDDPVITSDAGDASGTAVEAGNKDDGTLEAGDPSATGTLTWSDVDNGATATWSGDATGTYGDFAIDPNTGDWTYTLENNDADTEALAEGDVVTDTFTATIADEHGGTATQVVTITITGKNDSPEITSTAADAKGDVIEEGNLDNGDAFPGTPTATGTLTSSDVDAGATATWSIQGPGVGTFGEIVIDPNGTWTYTLDNSESDSDELAEGQTVTDTFTARVTDDKGAWVNQTVTITVTGTNDSPVITTSVQNSEGEVEELGNLDNGNPNAGDPTDTGTLTATDVDLGTVLTWTGDATGTYGSFTVDPNGSWTYTLDNTDTDTDVLAEGDTVTDVFTAAVTDEFGATATQTVTITVTGTNDSPVLTSAAADAEGAVRESGDFDNGDPDPGTPTATGTLTSSDVDTGATAIWSGDATGIYGDFTIDPNTGVWTYALNNADPDTDELAEGQTVTDTFTARVTDDKGAWTDQIVTITVTGTNESPVSTTTVQNTEGSVTEAGNKDNGDPINGDPTDIGSLSASDADLGAVLTWTGDATSTYGSFTVDPDGDWTYTLDNSSAATQALTEGETATDVFVATVIDEFGATATETVTITITGTNDVPVITSGAGDADGEIVEAGNLHDGTVVPGTPTATGTLTFDDVDAIVVDDASWTITPDTANTTDLGDITLDPDTGEWTYTLDQQAADDLGQNETVVETFTATITDEFGAYAEQTLTITITGTNDTAEFNDKFGAPPPRDAGAELLSIDVDDAMINVNGEATVLVSDYSASPTSSNDIIINDVGTEDLTQLTIKNFGGANDADDIIRLDLTAFDDDFELIIDGESGGDYLVLTGVDSVVYNADFTQTIGYTGSDGQTHVVTISNDISFDQVLHYPVADGVVDANYDDEVIGDGFTDYAGDEVDDTADNTIFGHGGADTITGGTGADKIFGDFDKPAGTLTEDLSQPTPTAEVLTFSITDTDIDGNGDVELDVDSIAVEVEGEEDITFVNSGTEPINSIHIARMGKGDGEQDVFRFDLSTFDDDFTITVWSEGVEDYFVFSNADSIVDNGDGTSSITYTGSDDQTHTVTIDTGLANLEFYTGEVSQEFDDVIDGAGGNDSVDGGYGQDTIDGGDGIDTLIGNVGADSIKGGAGDDAIYGDFNETLDPLPPRDPLPWAEELTVDIDDADIDDLDGTVEIPVNTLTSDPNMSQDVVINDGGTEAISEIKVTQLGGTQVDVIRLDLTGFDDDFDFIAENIGSEDVVIFVGADSIVDNGDGTQTITFTGSDEQTHTVLVDINTAQLEITYTTVDETAFDDHGDKIDGGLGSDTIDSGYGDDTIVASSGDDSVIGGTGDDSYDATSSTTLTDEAFDVTVDGSGDATAIKTVDGSTDTLTGVESIIADEEAGDDTISFTADVEANQILGLDGDETGIFTPDDGNPIAFGGLAEPSLGEILAGTYTPPGRYYPINPSGNYVVNGDDLRFQVDETTFDNFEQVNFGVNDPMVVCFCRGSHILTDGGEKLVEDLARGDKVLTLDNGYRPIKWIGRSVAVGRGNLAPVRIGKGAMGNTRELMVSQQHRVLLSGWQAELLFGEYEVLAPAKSLVNGKDVVIMTGGLVEYYHILFDRHELIYSDGILTESFFPGDQGMSAISDRARDEMFARLPELRTDPSVYGSTARRCLTVVEARSIGGEITELGRPFFLTAACRKETPISGDISEPADERSLSGGAA